MAEAQRLRHVSRDHPLLRRAIGAHWLTEAPHAASVARSCHFPRRPPGAPARIVEVADLASKIDDGQLVASENIEAPSAPSGRAACPRRLERLNGWPR